MIERVITAAHIPGAVAVVLRGDRILAAGVAGERKRGSGVAVTLDDAFEIASCTKAMTATLVADLVAEERPTWETTLGELWADASTPIDPAWQNVSVSQLLRHRSGARDRLGDFIEAARDDSIPPAQQRQHYVADVLAHPPASSPGETFHYNNTNYLIVAAALERLTAQTTEDLLTQRAFSDRWAWTPPGSDHQGVRARSTNPGDTVRDGSATFPCRSPIGPRTTPAARRRTFLQPPDPLAWFMLRHALVGPGQPFRRHGPHPLPPRRQRPLENRDPPRSRNRFCRAHCLQPSRYG